MTIELAFGILASSSIPFSVWMQKNGIEMLSHGRGAQLRPWGSLTPATTRGPRPRPTWQADLVPPAMGERKRRPRCRPWGRESGSRAAVHGEEEEEVVGHGEDEEEVAPSSRGKRKKISRHRPWRRGRGAPRAWGRGKGARRPWGRGALAATMGKRALALPLASRRREEGARRPRRRGRSRTVKRQSGPIPLNTEGSGSVLG